MSELEKTAECARELRRLGLTSSSNAYSGTSLVPGPGPGPVPVAADAAQQVQAKRVFRLCLNLARNRLERLRKSPLGKQLGEFECESFFYCYYLSLPASLAHCFS